MSDADCTAEADDAQLERIRRLIAEVRADRVELDDRTIEAEPEALERLRHIASGADDGMTRVATSGFPPPNDPEPAATHPPVRTPAKPTLPPEQSRRPRQVPTASSPSSQPDHMAPLASRRVVLNPAQPWVPPPRSMRPEPEASSETPEVQRWRLATFALAAVLVTLILGWVVLGRGGANDPTPTTVPGATYPATNRPIITTQTSSSVADDTTGDASE